MLWQCFCKASIYMQHTTEQYEPLHCHYLSMSHGSSHGGRSTRSAWTASCRARVLSATAALCSLRACVSSTTSFPDMPLLRTSSPCIPPAPCLPPVPPLRCPSCAVSSAVRLSDGPASPAWPLLAVSDGPASPAWPSLAVTASSAACRGRHLRSFRSRSSCRAAFGRRATACPDCATAATGAMSTAPAGCGRAAGPACSGAGFWVGMIFAAADDRRPAHAWQCSRPSQCVLRGSALRGVHACAMQGDARLASCAVRASAAAASCVRKAPKPKPYPIPTPQPMPTSSPCMPLARTLLRSCTTAQHHMQAAILSLCIVDTVHSSKRKLLMRQSPVWLARPVRRSSCGSPVTGWLQCRPGLQVAQQGSGRALQHGHAHRTI